MPLAIGLSSRAQGTTVTIWNFEVALRWFGCSRVCPKYCNFDKAKVNIYAGFCDFRRVAEGRAVYQYSCGGLTASGQQ
jgi:hypothetical protein